MRDDLIVVPIFSTGRGGPTRVMVSARSTGLRHDSIAFCDEITTIDRDFLYRGPVGTLTKSLLEAVVRGIRRALGDVVADP
jgi:mRNA interferase MazF